MSTRNISRLAAIVLMIAMLVMAIAVSPAAAQDRKAPTAPTNLRVTGMTAHSVSLAWNPSTDKSGSLSYTVCCAVTFC
jgi:hypothetical protein